MKYNLMSYLSKTTLLITFSLLFNSCNDINQFEYDQTMSNLSCYLKIVDSVSEYSLNQKLKNLRSTKIISGPITIPDDYKCIKPHELMKEFPIDIMDSCFHADSKIIDLKCLRVSNNNEIVIEISLVKRNGIVDQLSRFETREFHRIVKGELNDEFLKKFTFNGEQVKKKEMIGDNIFYLVSQVKI